MVLVAITVVDVLDFGPRPEHQVPDSHENGRVQGHVVDHERVHDQHLEVGQHDGRKAQRDQLRYQHVRVHHHILEVPSALGGFHGRLGGRRRRPVGPHYRGGRDVGRDRQEHHEHRRQRVRDPAASVHRAVVLGKSVRARRGLARRTRH